MEVPQKLYAAAHLRAMAQFELRPGKCQTGPSWPLAIRDGKKFF
jgi:hypothetical protein